MFSIRPHTIRVGRLSTASGSPRGRAIAVGHGMPFHNERRGTNFRHHRLPKAELRPTSGEPAQVRKTSFVKTYQIRSVAKRLIACALRTAISFDLAGFSARNNDFFICYG